MIKIKSSKDDIVISGHANYEDYGKDIVCASVSSIAITTINACYKFDSNAIKAEQRDGYLKISIIKHINEIDTLISNMMEEFNELESKYPKNIKIN